MVLTNISFQLQSKFLYASAADEGSCYYFSHFIKLYKTQRVISCSARLIFKAPKSAHITPLLYDLHWLPISSLIQYKIALIYFHIVSGTAPPYLKDGLRIGHLNINHLINKMSDISHVVHNSQPYGRGFHG